MKKYTILECYAAGFVLSETERGMDADLDELFNSDKKLHEMETQPIELYENYDIASLRTEVEIFINTFNEIVSERLNKIKDILTYDDKDEDEKIKQVLKYIEDERN